MKALLLLLLITLPLTVSAKGNIVAEGTMTQDFPLLMAIYRGTLECPGGGYIPDPLFGQICHPDANIHMRDSIVTNTVDGVPNDMILGTGYITLKVNWSEIGEGPYSGTWSLILENYDWHWEGEFVAYRTFLGTEWLSELKAVGHATGVGAPEYQLRFNLDFYSKFLYPVSYEFLNTFFGTSYTGPEGAGTYFIKDISE